MSKLQKIMADNPVWRDAFKSSAINVGFRLHLTRAMCEFLSAVADDVAWDRSKYGSAAAFPDNFVATAGSLVKRGLIVSKPPEQKEKIRCDRIPDSEWYTWSHWLLTPAGESVVELLKFAGLFLEADAAIEKRSKRK